MVFIEPLDLQYLLINTFAGTTEIFMFVSVLVIAILAGRFRMPNLLVLVMFALFTIFLSAYINGLYAFTVIITGLAVFYSLGRIWKS